MKPKNWETEVKISLPDAVNGRKLLRRAGFSITVPRSFESNVLFDTAEAALGLRGKALRLRSARGRVVLTLKGPSEISVYKSRSETELEVSSLQSMTAILEGLGFSPQFRYEKYRTEYRRNHSPEVVVLDETPIGVYLEIEGNPRSIDRTARLLGFNKEDYNILSYCGLYQKYCQDQNILPTDMVFPPTVPSKRKETIPRKK